MVTLYTCYAQTPLYEAFTARDFEAISIDLAREIECFPEDFGIAEIELADGATIEIVTLAGELVGCFDRPLTNDEADYIDSVLSAPVQFQLAAE